MFLAASFFSAASCKKGFKNGAARNFFGPSYFDPTLDWPEYVGYICVKPSPGVRCM